MSEIDPIVIVGIARTPQGSLLGVFKDITALQLGSIAIKAAVERAKLSPKQITDVFMGCVLTAGLGQAPARQASLAAGLPVSIPCTTINKMCASAMQAVMIAHDNLLANPENIIVAGGMESMSHAPYLVPKARVGYRLGHGALLDHMLWDGLEDAYEAGRPMGYFAELCAQEYGLTRQQQDDYARTSLLRTKQADFSQEIVAVNGITQDEHPYKVNIEKIPSLKPVFLKDGTITAASSAAIADGASALVMMRLSLAKKRGIKPIAKIIGYSSYATLPAQFPTAPIHVIKQLLKNHHWNIDKVDLFEINEAFATVALAAMKDLFISHEKLNIHGGSCALGHPIGATGTRIIATLISALQQRKLKRGIASLCIGGGEATAVAIEML